MPEQQTLLGIGAHYDDCVYGIPGTMLQAVAKNYRVVQLILIGDYSNWPPTKGREKKFLEGAARLAHDAGIDTHFLDFASHRYEFNAETKKKVADAVYNIKPDIAFQMWEYDHHHDHTIASQLTKVALRHGGRIINADDFKRPRTIYQYDNGPGHTVGFEPDTYVDISDYWQKADELLGRYMALMQNRTYNPRVQSSAQRGKETLARYRGSACGVKYAEAFWSPRKRPSDIL